MPEVEVHRRLVKSPPELWAELSDVEGLARHLGEFGEIRITRTDPETTVAWEGERARGTVEIEPSGWGTKVTLTAEPVGGRLRLFRCRLLPPDPAAGAVAKADRPAIAKPGAEPSATPDPHPVVKRIATPGAELIAKQGPERVAKPGPEPTAKQGAEPVAKPNPELIAKPEPKPIANTDPAPVAKPAPLAEEQAAKADPEPKPATSEPPAPPVPVAAPPKKPGFFARLFRRRTHAPPVAPEPDPVPAPVAQEEPKPEPMRAPAAEAKPTPMREPAAEPKPEPAAEPGPEPKAEETTAPRPTPDSRGERDTKWVVNADPERLVDRDPIVEPQAKPEPAVEADVPEVEPVVTDERAIAVLTAALDALGSAHHRPFSRG